MGRAVTGAEDPVILYVSGGNTQVGRGTWALSRGHAFVRHPSPGPMRRFDEALSFQGAAPGADRRGHARRRRSSPIRSSATASLGKPLTWR